MYSSTHFLGLSIDIRDQILDQLLPESKIIVYKCLNGRLPIGTVSLPHLYARCGKGSGWRSLRPYNGQTRSIAFMRVNKQLYEDAARLLYEHTYQIDVEDSGFFGGCTSSRDVEKFAHLPWELMRCVRLSIEGLAGDEDCVTSAMIRTRQLCSILRQVDNIRRLEVEWLVSPRIIPKIAANVFSTTILTPFLNLKRVEGMAFSLRLSEESRREDPVIKECQRELFRTDSDVRSGRLDLSKMRSCWLKIVEETGYR